jgi:hypothetical protein
MRQAQKETSQDTDSKRGGRFSKRPTLPFDPTYQNIVPDAAHVYSLLKLTGIDINGQVQHMVQEALKEDSHELRASTPTHDTCTSSSGGGRDGLRWYGGKDKRAGKKGLC